MAQSLNKTLIIGRLGMEPELRQGKNSLYTNFSIANKTTRDGQEEVQWHRVCAFGKQAELVHAHLHKGDLCCIEGRLDVYTYEKNGEKRSGRKIIAEHITFLSSRRSPAAPSSGTAQDSFEEAFSE